MAAVVRRLVCQATNLLKRNHGCNNLIRSTSFPATRNFTSLHSHIPKNYEAVPTPHLQVIKPTGLLSQCLKVYQQSLSPNFQQVRTKVYFSRKTGKPRNVTHVTERFFRLGNGMWIRTRPGRNKGKYKKDPHRLRLLQRHVFCTRRQCQMLDKMASQNFKERRYYLNDPYEIYHRTDMLPIFRNQAKPFYP